MLHWKAKVTCAILPTVHSRPPATPTFFLANSQSAFLSFPETWDWPGMGRLHVVFNLETPLWQADGQDRQSHAEY